MLWQKQATKVWFSKTTHKISSTQLTGSSWSQMQWNMVYYFKIVPTQAKFFWPQWYICCNNQIRQNKCRLDHHCSLASGLWWTTGGIKGKWKISFLFRPLCPPTVSYHSNVPMQAWELKCSRLTVFSWHHVQPWNPVPRLP